MTEKYDHIGIGYNTTRQADPLLTERLIHFLEPTEEDHYLDVGCGTGNYTIALYQKGIAITGIDPSHEMLAKAKNQNDKIHWIHGKAESLPFSDNQFEGAIATLTIHHWNNLKAGCGELFRIIKPGCSVVIFTSTPEQMSGYWLNHYFPEMLQESMIQMPSFDKIQGCLNLAGFQIKTTENYNIQPDLKDLFLYSGKHDPSMYFNAAIRNGISSFSHLANQKEINQGLELLATDIKTGKITQVVSSYSNTKGDYLFIEAVAI